MKINELSESVISGAIEVHRVVGPGLLESAYEECLAREFALRGIPFERQKNLPIEYKGSETPNDIVAVFQQSKTLRSRRLCDLISKAI